MAVDAKALLQNIVRAKRTQAKDGKRFGAEDAAREYAAQADALEKYVAEHDTMHDLLLHALRHGWDTMTRHEARKLVATEEA